MENKFNSRKQTLIISFLVFYIISVILSIHVFNIMALRNDSFNITDVEVLINEVKNSLINKTVIMPVSGYFKVFLIITVTFGLLMINSLMNIKNTMPDIEKGSASFGSISEVNRKLADKDPKNNFILSKRLRVSMDQRKTGLNGHVLTVAGSGAGKTRCMLLNNLVQMNSSYIVLDVKGEIYDYTAKLFKENGYKVKVLNLRKLEKSFKFNPFKYFIDETSVYKFVEIIINATGKDSNDSFWINNARTLLNAACMYVYQELLDEEKNMLSVSHIVNSFESREEDESYKSAADIIFEDLYEKKGETLAYKLYKKVRKNNGKTLKSIIGDVNTRLSVFDFENMRNIFSGDELDLDSFTDEKTILYLVVSDTNSAFDFIVNIFYQVSIDYFIEKADNRGAFKIPLRYHMDEFCNTGKIGGENGFKKILATARSREMFFSLYVQSVNDIKALYKDDFESIMDNLDIKCWLGKSSFKWVSEMLGKQTIETVNSSRSKGKNGSISESYNTLGRELLTVDEAQRFDRRKSIIFINGEKPIMDFKYDISKNKLYNSLGNPKTKENILDINKLIFDVRK